MEAMQEALKEEVRMTNIENGTDQEEWRNTTISQWAQVLLTICFNMGWQKWSSEDRYDSLSRHAFMIGACLKKIIQCNVNSKLCMTCYHANRLNKKTHTHHCPQNYSASSKAMEEDAVLTLYKICAEPRLALVLRPAAQFRKHCTKVLPASCNSKGS